MRLSFLSKLIQQNNCQRRFVYTLTKQWPITCSYDDTCTPRYLKQIESYWKPVLERKWTTQAERAAKVDQVDRYILSMFPYPSGSLHLGHCRLYASSDTIVRYNLLRQRTCWHPMGWDSFGLPAENAAIQKNVDPKQWTERNVEHMRNQLDSMGFNFNYMEATSDPSFYRWTQWLFLQLLDKKLAYKSYAMVNWDPIDKTVLAKEQIDDQGRSWRSGALVEQRYMKQWFVKTSGLMHRLYEAPGLDEQMLGWRQLIKIQRSWFGKPNCYAFYFNSECGLQVPVVARDPETLVSDLSSCLQVSSKHWLTMVDDIKIINPFTGKLFKVEIDDHIQNDFYAHVKCGQEQNIEKRTQVLKHCQQQPELGGYRINDNFHDWLVSRQRYWGTPIPTVECKNCGIQPISEQSLPVVLPDIANTRNQLKEEEEKKEDRPISRLYELAPPDWLQTDCPKCGSVATRETDTFDTFVDSSWYFLRYASLPSSSLPFDANRNSRPVWLYLGGSEHASGHLFYARFMYHFLRVNDLLPNKNSQIDSGEPFERILFQGMVNSRTFSYLGKYIDREEAKQLLESGQAKKKQIVTRFEKMSKSKANGVDPLSLLDKYGMDATRYCILGATSSQKTRNWQGEQSEFYAGMRTLRKLILTVEQFIYGRQIEKEKSWAPVVRRYTLRKLNNPTDIETILKGFQTIRNLTVRDVTIAFEFDLKPGAASKRLQEMLDFIRKQSLTQPVGFHPMYQRCLADLLIMYSPILPHLCEELWTGLRDHLDWDRLKNFGYIRDKLCCDQPWPDMEKDFEKCIQISWLPTNGKHMQRLQIPVDERLLIDKKRSDLEQMIRKTIEEHEALQGMKVQRLSIYSHLHCDVLLVTPDYVQENEFDED